MVETRMKIGDTFFKAEQLENLAGEVYDLLARRLAANTDAAGLFERLAREERQHARRVQMLRLRIVGQPGVHADLHLPADRIDDLIATATALKDRYSQDALPALDLVLQELVATEERFAVAHAEIIAGTQDADTQRLFALLCKHDRAHRELLASVQARSV